MPNIQFEGRTLSCERGANLRKALLANGLSPYNGMANNLNCRGHATCGTCAVRVTGEVSNPGAREKFRLSLPPHNTQSGLRLSCQCEVLGDLKVEKFEGFWGQKVTASRPIQQKLVAVDGGDNV